MQLSHFPKEMFSFIFAFYFLRFRVYISKHPFTLSYDYGGKLTNYACLLPVLISSDHLQEFPIDLPIYILSVYLFSNGVAFATLF